MLGLTQRGKSAARAESQACANQGDRYQGNFYESLGPESSNPTIVDSSPAEGVLRFLKPTKQSQLESSHAPAPQIKLILRRNCSGNFSSVERAVSQATSDAASTTAATTAVTTTAATTTIVITPAAGTTAVATTTKTMVHLARIELATFSV